MAITTSFDDADAILAVQRRKHQRSAVIRYAILTVVGLIMLYPLIWLVGASFKTNEEIFASPGFLPQHPTISGYVAGWQTSTPIPSGGSSGTPS